MKRVTIGRGSGNDIVINNDNTVTRVAHCTIVLDENGIFYLMDNSKNGTFVNGRKIERGRETVLKPTDVIRIGNTTLPWRTYFGSSSPDPVEAQPDEWVANPTPPPIPGPEIRPSPLIEIPANINVRQENINANVVKKGNDFSVPFNRNMGHILGNTMGCATSVIIILVLLVIVGLIIANVS